MAAPRTSILLVDDHAVIAAPIRMALEANGFGPVVSADPADLSPTRVLELAAELRPDVVLLDLHLGTDTTALPMVGPLVALGPKVVLFTASQDPLLIAPALRAGAVAVIDKSISFERLVSALHDLAETGELMTKEEREALLEVLGSHEDALAEQFRPFSTLTPKESEVFRDLIAGRSPKEIARASGSSLSTVRGHIQHVLSKLHVSNQREALAVARAAGWPGQGV